MKIRLTPISVAIVLLASNSAYATGGTPGTNGTSDANGITLIGSGSSGFNVQVTDQVITGQTDGAPGGNATGNGVNVGIAGGGGSGGQGGASVIGGISQGGAGGFASGTNALANAVDGGAASAVSENTLSIKGSTLKGSNGGSGSNLPLLSPTTSSFYGSGGSGGLGGGSVVGGMSQGGAGGGTNLSSPRGSAYGGIAGDVTKNKITLTNSKLEGGLGGAGGSLSSTSRSDGAGGAGGHGGGSVFGGISIGAAGGGHRLTATSSPADAFSAYGGAGGNVTDNTIFITGSVLTGAEGGTGGSVISITTGSTNSNAHGGTGSGGHGGGSVFGGLSQGGAGGYGRHINGGSGGDVTGNTISITDSTLIGSKGGEGGERRSSSSTTSAISSSLGGTGAGGFGGGSVFGGVSQGAAAGSIRGLASSATGGDGGNVTDNIINLTDTKLTGALGGRGGLSQVFTQSGSGTGASFNSGGKGFTGYQGGSVFGGISQGGSGGVAQDSAIGGVGGNVLKNRITISGVSTISGDIYGGLSQGGERGATIAAGSNDRPVLSQHGLGGFVQDNIITLIGQDITIGGSIYGGRSLDGAGNDDDTKAFSGNTLNPTGYSGSVKGIYNVENYNWVLPFGVKNQDTLISITGTDLVKLDNTKHSVAMYNDGKELNGGDQIIMIDKVQGNATFTNPNSKIRQGLFLVYDAKLDTKGDDLVLSIFGKENTSPTKPPAGELHPTSKSYLQGRLATLATLNQGADVIVEDCRTNVFGMLNGSSSRYDTGSHIKVHDVSLVLGGSNCFELQNKNTVMLGAYIQHGSSNYDSYNNYGIDGDVHGWGKVRYTGLGLLFHMNVAGTGSQAGNTGAPVQATEIGSKDGLYINAALSAGKAKTRFDSDIVDAEGIRGEYDSKSNYVTAMAGVGYAWKIDEKQLLDFYGRYNWTHLGSDSVMMGMDRLELSSLHSSRVRLGARYNYAYKPNVKPYVELAYAHEFAGTASGVAYNKAIDEPSLKGGTGILEVGLNIKPSATNQAWTVNLGVQGYVGQRQGAGAEVKVRYAF